MTKSNISFLFFCICLLIYILNELVDKEIYRKELGLINLFIFHPCLILSVIFGVKGIYNNKNSTQLIIINLFGILFFILYLIKIFIRIS